MIKVLVKTRIWAIVFALLCFRVAWASSSVMWESSQYLSSLPESPELDRSQLVSVSINYLKQKSDQSWKFDFTAGKYLDWGDSHFAVKELYYQKDEHWSLGRKRQFWSEADQNWHLGLWEPHFVVDALRPAPQGLSGIFYEASQGPWHALAYWSPLFVPTMGPEIREKSGSLVAYNRWYRQPVRSVAFMNDKDLDLAYSLNIPEMADLANNWGAGARLKWEDSSGAWMSANLAYKPINSLLIRYDRELALAVSGSQGEVEVGPAVGYHWIGGMDIGYRTLAKEISFSILQDRPQRQLPVNEAADQNWIQQQPRDMSLFALHSRVLPPELGWLNPTEITFDYLRVIQAPTEDLDSSGNTEGSLFPYRSNFTNAMRIGASYQMMAFGRELRHRLSWMREFDQKGILLQYQANYLMNAQLRVMAGLDVLGVDDANDVNSDPVFLNEFRANDRLTAGLEYVF